MPNRKQVVVSFRVDQHLANVLNRLPDKSAFIRHAIEGCFYQPCPVCVGRGLLPDEVARWAREQLHKSRPRRCTCCGYEFPEAVLAETDGPIDRKRFLCDQCRQTGHRH